jgi:hypothetical protein
MHSQFGFVTLFFYYFTHAQLLEFGKETQLMNDVNLRWNSLHFKLERFDKVITAFLNRGVTFALYLVHTRI